MGWEEGWRNFELADRTAYRARMLEELTIDPRRTAVVAIDMQYNYLDPDTGGLPVLKETAEHVVTSSERLFGMLRERSVPVIHAYTVRRQIEIDRGFFNAGVALMQAGVRNKVSQLPHAGVSPLPDRLAGTRQAAVVESLTHSDDIHVTTKRTMDPFQFTELDLLLERVFNVDTVVLTGINTDTCVYSGAFSAANRGYKTVVVADCVASTRGPDSHLMALEVMSRSIAWVLTVDQVQDALA